MNLNLLRTLGGRPASCFLHPNLHGLMCRGRRRSPSQDWIRAVSYAAWTVPVRCSPRLRGSNDPLRRADLRDP